MLLKKISEIRSVLKNEVDINNSNFNGRFSELKNLLCQAIDNWNYIFYAIKKIENQEEQDYDVRFYYQTIVFNLYMLSNISKRIGKDVIESNTSLKDLRNNIAHLDEKLKEPLNKIEKDKFDIENSREPTAIINGECFYGNLNGTTTDGIYLSSSLGVYGDVIYSTLKPSDDVSYSSQDYKENGFVSFKINEEELLKVGKQFKTLLKKYYSEIKTIT